MKLLALSLLLTGSAYAETSKDRALRETAKLMEKIIGSHHALLLQEIRSSNRTFQNIQRDYKVPHTWIRRLDEQWIAWRQGHGEELEFIQQVMTNPCSQSLRMVMNEIPGISEVFITNQVGTTVCAAEPPSDYDQGDEDKWYETFVHGISPYIGQLAHDESTGKVQIQVSYLLHDGKEKVGVITIAYALTEHMQEK